MGDSMAERRRAGRAVWLILGLGLAAGGCGQDADRLSRVCHKTAARFDGVTEGLRGKLSRAWAARGGPPGEATVEGRVAVRLRWDRDLEGADVHVEPVGPGVVRLRGCVADLAQRTRALELARSTRGVAQVQDALTEDDAADRP
jgi:osmotically-inducible protein OsmY